MKNNFIDTIVVGNKIYVFRFLKDEKEGKYTISQVDDKSIPGFTMRMTRGKEWQIEGKVRNEIRAFEKLLSDIIIDNNSPGSKRQAAGAVLEKIQAYTQAHLKSGKPKPELRIETLMLDLNTDRETLISLLTHLQNAKLVQLKLNIHDAGSKRSTLIGTVALAD